MPYIAKGVLITDTLMLNLGEVYAVEKLHGPLSIKFSIRGACKKDIIITRDCETIWQLVTEYFDWEIDEDNLD